MSSAQSVLGREYERRPSGALEALAKTLYADHGAQGCPCAYPASSIWWDRLAVNLAARTDGRSIHSYRAEVGVLGRWWCESGSAALRH